MRRVLALGAALALSALAACATVAPVIVPPDVSDQAAGLSCQDAGQAFGTAAATLAAHGVEAVLTGGFDQILAVAKSIVAGDVTAQNVEVVTAAVNVVALGARLQDCPPISVQIRRT